MVETIAPAEAEVSASEAEVSASEAEREPETV
jgi:hypothetical protein